jgi:cation:H+ antiporter
VRRDSLRLSATYVFKQAVYLSLTMIPVGLEMLALPAFIAGVLLLYKGSDILVDGTSKTAAHFGVSTLIISVIIIAFGTSAPELAISVGAALQRHADISVGNIIGSCIANLLLVLGLSAVIRPINVQKSTIKRELPIMIGVTLLFLLTVFLGLLDFYHIFGGILYLGLFAVFLHYFITLARKERRPRQQIDEGEMKKNIFFIIFGIIGVVVGAELLIESAVTIATVLGISQMVIALSMVAIGTSLPELVVSAMAAYKKESDIALGNVIGSNVFNIFLILGLSALIIPLDAMNSLQNIVLLLIVSIIMLPLVYFNHTITRVKGILLLVLYAVFLGYLFLW